MLGGRAGGRAECVMAIVEWVHMTLSNEWVAECII